MSKATAAVKKAAKTAPLPAKKTAVKKIDNSKIKKGTGVYVCVSCGHNTRETGDGAHTQQCELCWDKAGYENVLMDNKEGRVEHTQALEAIAKIDAQIAARTKSANKKVIAAPVVSAVGAKTEKKFTEAARLAKRFRRATWGSSRTKYAKDAFAISREYVSGALKTMSVAEVEAHIETIKQSRKSAANLSGTAEVKPKSKRSTKSHKVS